MDKYIKDRLIGIQLELLQEFDRVCRREQLRYSLAYGTLIGAVRHGGYIPWDDDIDVVMPRDDYERLIERWAGVSSSRYVLVDYRKYPDYPCNFAKIRMRNTRIIQHEYEKKRPYPKGIFIDVFPLDRKAGGFFGSMIQKVACAFNLLYTKGFASGRGGLIGLGESILLLLPRKLQIAVRDKSEMVIRGWNSDSNAGWFGTSLISDMGVVFDSDLFDNMSSILFEGDDYACVRDYDGFLRKYYGDYMTLPPENEREEKHKPIELSFEIGDEVIES